MRASAKVHKRQAGRRPKAGSARGDTRAAILAAARSVFARRGLDGASVREVARSARVNNAMIYYHFRDKDALYRSVLSDSFSALADIWRDDIFTSARPVREKIGRYAESFIRFQQNNEDLRRIMAMEFAGSGGNFAWICREYFADNYRSLMEIFKEGVKNGELRKCDSSLAVSSLIGVILHNFILRPMAEHIHGRRVNLSPKKFGPFITDLFLRGLASGPQARNRGRRKRTRSS